MNIEVLTDYINANGLTKSDIVELINRSGFPAIAKASAFMLVMNFTDDQLRLVSIEIVKAIDYLKNKDFAALGLLMTSNNIPGPIADRIVEYGKSVNLDQV